jgi:hypothetical protein
MSRASVNTDTGRLYEGRRVNKETVNRKRYETKTLFEGHQICLESDQSAQKNREDARDPSVSTVRLICMISESISPRSIRESETDNRLLNGLGGSYEYFT